MKSCQKLPDLDHLKYLFSYDPSTGLLTRNVAGRGGNSPKGSTVGCPNRFGHLRVKIGSYGYAVHRIIWYMMTGIDPMEMLVDHKDTDPANNKWHNLRLADHSVNCLNSDRKNKSKVYPGVHKRKGKWLARIGIDYKRVHLGYFDTMEEAIRARKAAEVELANKRNDEVLMARGVADATI